MASEDTRNNPGADTREPYDLLDYWLEMKGRVDQNDNNPTQVRRHELVPSATIMSSMMQRDKRKRKKKKKKKRTGKKDETEYERDRAGSDEESITETIRKKKKMISEELQTNYLSAKPDIPPKKNHGPVDPGSNDEPMSEPVTQEEAPRPLGTAEDSIFFQKSERAESELLRDRDIADLMGLLCLNTGVRRVENPNDDGITITPVQRYTEDELLAKLSINEDELESTDDVFYQLIDPNCCKWTNDEWACSWLMMATSRPLKLLRFFSDTDEISFFLSELRKRGASKFGVLMHSEHVRGWSLAMLLAILHGMLINEFKEFVFSTFAIKESGRRGNAALPVADEFEDFLSTNLLFTMSPRFDQNVYLGPLYKMGIVPFPHRPTFRMDLWDIKLSLSCLMHAWRLWDFWFGFSFGPEGINDFSETPFSVGSKKLTELDCSSRPFVEHVHSVMAVLDLYIYWLYFRFVEICSHESMDPKETAIKEHMFYISGMIYFVQTFINLFSTLYEENERSLSRTGSTLRDFAESIFASDDASVDCPQKKTMGEHEAQRTAGFIPNPNDLGPDIIKETLDTATHGVICDDIVTKIEGLLTPIHTNILYHSRSGGYGMNAKIAVRETLPRSLQVNQHEFMDIIAGSMDKIDNGLPSGMKWKINFSLQLQGIDTCIGQFEPAFIWSKHYLIEDTDVPHVMKDLRPWPTASDTKKTNRVDDLVRKLERKDGDKHPSLIAFRSEHGDYRSLAVIRFGCVLIVHGYGHSFCTPSMTEAFCAWVILKDTYEGWNTEFSVEYLAEDKTIQKRMVVCNLQSGVQHILHKKFLDASTFRGEIDQDVLKRLDKRVGDRRNDNRAGLTEEDLEGKASMINASDNRML